MATSGAGRVGRNHRQFNEISAAALALGLFLPSQVLAANCGSFSTTSTVGSAAHCTTFVWTGTLGTVINNGTLVASSTGTLSNNAGFSIQGGKTLTQLTNNNLIGGTGTSGGYSGLLITGTPTTTTTSGTITYGVGAYTSVTSIVNNATGSILSDGAGGAIRMANGVLVGTLANSGSILSNGLHGVNLVGGNIGTLTNSGLIQSTSGGAINVDVVNVISTIGSIDNSGTLAGNSATVGALNVFGVVTSANNSGIILNAGGSGVKVSNYGSYGPTATNHSHVGLDGTIGTLTNSGAITGSATGAGVSIGPGGSILSLVNAATGTIQGGSATVGGINVAATTGNASVTHAGYLGTIANSGLILNGIVNAGTILALNNSGSLSGGVTSSGALGTIINTGVISGDLSLAGAATLVGGTAGTVGTFTGAGGGSGTITALSGLQIGGGALRIQDNINVGTGTLMNMGSSLTITNQVITGAYRQTLAASTLTTSYLSVTNNITLAGGTIAASFASTGNYVVGTAATVIYAPRIVNLGAAFLAAQAPVGAHFSNIGASGTTLVYFNPLTDYIGGALAQVTVSSSLNGLSTIAPTALYIAGTGTLGTLTNTGTIRGNIVNLSANDLSIKGGTLTTIGTLTGYSNSIGTITNTLSNVVLASGNIRLNDVVNAGTHALVNAGANLSFGTLGTVSVTGDFAQTSSLATLSLGSSLLSISGAASIAGTVISNFATTTNHTIGELATLVTADGGVALGYGTLAGTVTGATGLNVLGTVSGNSLLAMIQNYYIAGTYGTITNSGTISAPTAIYVAAGGSLGAVSNSGVIQGNIANASANDLNLVGGSGAAVGTFVGADGASNGTITNTASNVNLSGNLRLRDVINVGGHTVNNAATLQLASDLSITGNFSQTSGTLVTSIGGGKLSVSGVAGLTGGAIVVNGFSGAANALYGQDLNTPLVAGGAGSNYSGVSIQSDVAGLELGGLVSGNTLSVQGANNYVGGALASLTNSGLLSGAINPVYVAAAGSLGTLTNSSTLSGSGAGLQNLGQVGLVQNTGLLTGQLYAINNSGTLGSIVNSGTIAGNIANSGAAALTIVGGNATQGLLTGYNTTTGTIQSANGVVFAGGNVLLNDHLDVASSTVTNSGATLALANSVTITGNYSQSAGTLALGQSVLTVSGVANLAGGAITTGQLAATGNYSAGGNSISLVQAGLGSSYAGANLASGVAGLSIAASTTTLGSTVNLSLSVINQYVGGSLASLANSGAVANVATAAYIATTGALGSLTNSGTLLGSDYGLRNRGAIDQIDNSGLASGRVGVWNQGTIGTLRNSGTMEDTPAVAAAGLNNSGSIALVDSSGTISGLSYGVYNSGSIGTLSNSGLITGATGLYIASTGTLGLLANSGTISGNIQNLSANALTIAGGTGGAIGSLTGGTIISTGADVVLASGTIALADQVNMGAHTLVNSGAAVTLGSGVSVTGNFSQSAGLLALGTSTLSVSGTASLTGGTVAGALSATANYMVGDSATLIAAGAGSSYVGVSVANPVGGLTGSALNSGGNLLFSVGNDYVGGNLASLSVSGALANTAGGATALYIAATGTLGQLVNSGTISGNIVNLSANALTIAGGSGGAIGRFTGGTITSTGADVVLASGAIALGDNLQLGAHTATNAGANISLANDIVVNGNFSQSGGTLDLKGYVLTVNGVANVAGGVVTPALSATANYLSGQTTTLISGGVGSGFGGMVLSNTVTGLNGSASNSANTLLFVVGNDYIGGSYGTLSVTGALANTTGGATALYIASTGTLGLLANSGTISGNIQNLSANALTITGGTGGAIGSLTGGTIISSGADVVLASGTIALVDQVNMGAHTLVNSGAAVTLGSGVSVTGNFSQSAGLLALGTSTLSVSGTASLTGGTVAGALSATANYMVGDSATLIAAGAGSSYVGVSVANPVGGLTGSALNSGGNLLFSVGNDYVGGNLASLSVSGALANTAGGATALYIAATGTLGQLVNSGTISGNIVNLSANALTIAGGTGGAIGRFTGGTITSTGADVVLASGAIALGDNLQLGAHTATNAGANISLANDIVVNGNFSQSGGLLDTNGHVLTVGGAAVISGGQVQASFASAANYFAGDVVHVIAGGAGSNFANAQLVSNLAGLSAAASVSGNSLMAVAANSYIGASYGTLSVSGALANTAGGATALYIASSGSLGQLANSGTISGNVVNLSATALTIAGGTNGATGTFANGSILNTGADVVLASGHLVLTDQISVGSHTLVNNGASVLLTDTVTLSGNYAQNAGTLGIGLGANSAAGLLQVSGNAQFTGGAVAVSALAGANLIAGQDYTIARAAGSLTTSNLSALSDGFSASLSIAQAGAYADLLLHLNSTYIGGSTQTVTNSGTISAATAVYVAPTGTLGTLTNGGLIVGNVVNLSGNDLTIAGGAGGTIGTFTGGTIANAGSNLVFASGAISLGSAIDATGHAVVNAGAAVQLSGDVSVAGNFVQNSGTLNANGHMLMLTGAATLTGGVVSAGLAATQNYFVGDGVTLIAGGAGSSYGGASITSGIAGLSASGVANGNNLVAEAANVYIGGGYGTLAVTGALSNGAGGATALYVGATGTLGQLVNSGAISGNVVNMSANALTIAGGSGGAVGAFAGGTIASAGANVVFAAGAISLGDAIQVGPNAAVNAGATIGLARDVTVSGNFSQTGGTLDLGGHVLSVSGAASVTGGAVNAHMAATGNYMAGQVVPLIAGGSGSSFSLASISSGVAGLGIGGSAAGNTLVATAGNAYVGGALPTLAVSGSLANGLGGPTALYIANTGTLGAIANSGTISGNIVNLSSHDLVISGGSAAAPGTITGNETQTNAMFSSLSSNSAYGLLRAMAASGGGGSVGLITNLASDVVFAGGAQVLNSNIDVGSHAVVNNGAALLINNPINITGNFSQTSGQLVFGVSSLSSHGSLNVSGTSSLAGGVVMLTGANGALQAGNYTIVSSGGAMSLGNVSFEATGYKVTGQAWDVGGQTDLVLSVAGVTTHYAPLGLAQGGPAIATALLIDQISTITSDKSTTTPEAAAVNVEVMAPLAELSPAGQRVALSQLSPNQLTPQMMAMVAAPVSDAIARHQQAVSEGLAGPQAPRRPGALWGEFIGGGGQRDATRMAAGFNWFTGGLVTGGDIAIGRQAAVGVAVSWTSNTANGTDIFAGSRSKTNSYQLTAYGSWRPAWANSRLSLDAQIGAAYNITYQQRRIDYLSRTATANFDGEHYMARFSAGFDIPVLSNLVITPQYAIRGARVFGSAYRETDAGAADMAAARMRVDTVTQEVGVKLGGQAGLVAPDVRVAWVHEYKDAPIATVAELGGVAYSSATGRLGQDGLSLDVGLTLRPAQNLRIRAGYSGELRTDYQRHTGSLNLSWSF